MVAGQSERRPPRKRHQPPARKNNDHENRFVNLSIRSSVALACLFPHTGLRAATSQPTPNIVFILADDLGYTDVACYGSKYYETPNIDRLAAAGMRFTSGYTCGPNCQPTRAALMSGQYGPRTGVYTVGGIDRFNWQSRPLRPVDNVGKLAPEKITLAEALKKRRLRDRALRQMASGRRREASSERPGLRRSHRFNGPAL